MIHLVPQVEKAVQLLQIDIVLPQTREAGAQRRDAADEFFHRAAIDQKLTDTEDTDEGLGTHIDQQRDAHDGAEDIVDQGGADIVFSQGTQIRIIYQQMIEAGQSETVHAHNGGLGRHIVDVSVAARPPLIGICPDRGMGGLEVVDLEQHDRNVGGDDRQNDDRGQRRIDKGEETRQRGIRRHAEHGDGERGRENDVGHSTHRSVISPFQTVQSVSAVVGMVADGLAQEGGVGLIKILVLHPTLDAEQIQLVEIEAHFDQFVALAGKQMLNEVE